ncbi:MAG TPA: glycoside hydrolase family 88 protein [Bacteroidales bacterium]|jgi:rhamnogalacturonyl hydrolase YesR|nr:glycoside hydrolase family 88 protein [Bacteroidales bacterium]
MKIRSGITLLMFFGLFACSAFSQNPQISKSSVKSLLKKVADYQVQTPLTHTETDWTNGALYAGMVEWASIAGDDKYYNWLMEIGKRNGWTYMHRDDQRGRYHADDYCVGQMYLEMYRKYKDPAMITPLREYFDQIVISPSTLGLEFEYTDEHWPTERWSWCDALFMGPTVWAKMGAITGDKKYLDFMYSEYKATTDYLFSTQNSLYFRDSRFFSRKETNGQPVHWGRGNGWVFAGLPIIIRELPKNYEHRDYFIKLYKDMAAKLISIQDENGYWHASLLDPASYPNPEMSATGFFVYGLAWGINNNLLDEKTCMPAITKGWKAMTEAVWPDGKVGWIQPIGEDPKSVTREMTEVYGVGAFLLAGTEIYKMAKKK